MMTESDKAKKEEPFAAIQGVNMDHPEQYLTEKESLFDRFESEQNVDPIPVEEKNQEVKDERNKDHTKDTSSMDAKYHTGF